MDKHLNNPRMPIENLQNSSNAFVQIEVLKYRLPTTNSCVQKSLINHKIVFNLILIKLEN